MSYQVLAQKYRPQDLDEVIDQEVVTRTLKNSIAGGRVANAYIFCGPRGVGKTSVARLVAKMLNCKKSSPSGPCNNCHSCVEINRGTSLDVLEIDGASNRGIDEVRTLRENVKFSPSSGLYRIYIIDEVHMLTAEAFNALLKTLEEPPAHVKFIFATTEAHKVLPTIMSRCQRFDFRRIGPLLIFERIKEIASKEGIKITDNAALLVARSADGSLRDALVILDQMVSFSSSEISAEDVTELLGMVRKEKIFELTDAIIKKDARKTTTIIDELISLGKDPSFITDNLISHFRDLLVLAVSGSPASDMIFSEEELALLNAQKEKLSAEELLYMLQNLTHCVTLMKGTFFPRAPLEIVLIKLTKRDSVMALGEIMTALKGDVASRELPSVRPRPADREPLPSGADAEGTSGEETAQWEAALGYIKGKKMSVFTFLQCGKLMEFGPGKLVVGFGKDHIFNKEILSSDENSSLIKEAVLAVVGKEVQIEFKVLDFLGSAKEDAAPPQKKKEKKAETLNPVIEKAMDIFGGHVVRDSFGEADT